MHRLALLKQETLFELRPYTPLIYGPHHSATGHHAGRVETTGGRYAISG